MPTENRRVATYLPSHIDESLESFKAERGIKGDSPALIAILSEYFGVSCQNSSVAHLENLVTKEEFEALSAKVEELVESNRGSSKSELLGELYAHLSSQVQNLGQVVEDIKLKIDELIFKPSEEGTLTTSQLAKRLNLNSSTISHYKEKSAEDIIRQTQSKDPDGIGWEYLKPINRFRPIGELPNELQGKLFNT